MWAPHPRGRVIRRPQPDFSHRITRIKKKAAARGPPNPGPDPRCNYKYFGIHRTDVTDYLKHVVPSHAFHPSLIAAPTPPVRGRCPARLRGIDERRPETAPAAPTAWFGRTSSDVSDWLRYRPPAHLGLDPDNQPLPHYPTSSSLVTDSKWQTREFAELPHVLWHWWAERPSSVPLATNPQHVKFDSLVNALKNKVIHVKPPGVYSTIPLDANQEDDCAQTPRSSSGAQTPRPAGSRGVDGYANQLGEKFNRSGRATPRSRLQTPRSADSETMSSVKTSSNVKHDQATREDAPKSVRRNGARSGEFSPRPSSAPSGTPSGINGIHNGAGAERGRASLSNAGTPSRPPLTPRPHSVAGEHPSCQESKPLGPCGCSPRASSVTSQSQLPGSRAGSCNFRAGTPAPSPALSPSGPDCLNGTSVFGVPSRSGLDLNHHQQVGAKKCRCNLPSTKQEATVARAGEAPKIDGLVKGSPHETRRELATMATVGRGYSQNDSEALACTGSRLSTPSGQGHADGGAAQPREDLPRKCTCRQDEVKRMGCTCAPSQMQEGYRASTPMKSSKPPPSPRVNHSCPLHEHQSRQTLPERHPAALPARLFIQGQGQGHVPDPKEVATTTTNNKVIPRRDLYTSGSSEGQGPTIQDLKDLSPDTFATKMVWGEKLKKWNGMAHRWSSEEKAFKSVKAC